MSDITMKSWHLRTLVVMICLSVVSIFGLVVYIHGDRKQVEGYALGCEAERRKNPSQEYIESGLSFCWDSGNWYQVKYTRGGFKVIGRP